MAEKTPPTGPRRGTARRTTHEPPPSVMVIGGSGELHAHVRRAALDAGFEVVAEPSQAQSVFEREHVHRVAAILLVCDGEGAGNADDSFPAVPALPSAVPVVAVGPVPDAATLIALLTGGVVGYVLIDDVVEQLPRALDAVLRGEATISPRLLTDMVAEFRRHPTQFGLDFSDRQDVALTAREWEVLEMLGASLSTHQIARHLFVADVTVRSHVAAIVRKLGVADRDEAVSVYQRWVQSAVCETPDAWAHHAPRRTWRPVA